MKYTCIILLAIVSSTATAQIKIYQQDSLIVTATNTQQVLTQTGRNIITIPGTTYNKLAINSVDELLRYVAGIEVQQRGVQGSQSDILIRGGTFQQVLILIDGIRLNDPLTGHFNGNIPIHPNAIHHIEILKGPASAVWGSDAVGGVIHIITKAFVNNNQPKQNEIHAGIQYGDYNTRNLNVAAAHQYNSVYASLGAMANSSTGNALRGTSNYFNNYTVHAATSITLPSLWQLQAKSILDYRDFNAQNYYTTFKSDTANEQVNTFFNHIQLQKKWGNKCFTTDISYKQLSDQFQYNPSSIANKNNTQQLVAQANYTGVIDIKTTYNTGVQYINKKIVSNDRGNHNLTQLATWLVVKHQLGKQVYLNESIRIDHNNNYGTVLTPQINVAYTPTQYVLRASYSQGIRDADFTERYNNYNKTLVTGGRIGNPNLLTEKTWNTEIGADYVGTKNLKVSVTAFYRNQNNLIDYTSTPYNQLPRITNLIPTGNYALAKNIDKVKTYGTELDLNWHKNISTTQQLHIQYNLTLLNSKNDDSIPSFYISAHAKVLSNVTVVYNNKHLTASINALYKLRNTQTATAINTAIAKDYFVLHTKIGYSFYNKINTFIQINNALNRNYSDILGSILPSRWVSAGINMAL